MQSYHNSLLQHFASHHSNNRSQLLHMAWANMIANLNQLILINTSFDYSTLEDLANALGQYLTGKQTPLLPASYISEHQSSNWQTVFLILLKQHVELVIKLAEVKHSLIITEQLHLNGKKFINALQLAGNKQLIIEKALKVWINYLNSLQTQIQNRQQSNLLQLQSFSLANQSIRLLS